MPTQFQSKPRIAFDANMLLAIAQHKIDVFSEAEKMFGKEAEYVVPEKVFFELKSLAEKNSKMKKDVEIGLNELKRHDVKVVEVAANNADEALANMAQEGYFVATNDASLRKRIKGFGGKVIYLRQLRFFELG